MTGRSRGMLGDSATTVAESDGSRGLGTDAAGDGAAQGRPSHGDDPQNQTRGRISGQHHSAFTAPSLVPAADKYALGDDLGNSIGTESPRSGLSEHQYVGSPDVVVGEREPPRTSPRAPPRAHTDADGESDAAFPFPEDENEVATRFGRDVYVALAGIPVQDRTDVAQKVMEDLCRKLPKLNRKCPFHAHVVGFCRKAQKAYRRGLGRDKKDLVSPHDLNRIRAQSVTTDDKAKAAEALWRLASGTMEDEEATIVFLHDVRRLSFRRIGEMFGMSKSVAHDRYHAALERLKRVIKRGGAP